MSDSDDELAQLRQSDSYRKARAAMGLTTAKTAPGTKSKEEEYLEDEPQRPRMARPAAEVDTAVAHEADVMAIMGFGSFGVSKGTTSLKSSDDPSLHMRRNDSSARPDAAGARATMQSGPGNHDDAEPGASPRGDDRPVNRSEEDEPEAGPPRPASDAGGGENDQDLDGGGESIDERLGLPVTHELTIQHHSRLVSCVAIDPAGARFATGSHDCIIHLYDFNGMTQQKRSYRTLDPGTKREGSYPVLALSWSPSGEHLLTVTGSAQPLLYDRDGHELGEFKRGDMYIRDMRNTKGHISACTWGQWHPTDKGTAITSSEDGTVRAWDMYDIVQTTVIKPPPVRAGTRVHVTTCAYSNDGSQIAAGLKDGSIHLYDVRGKFGYDAAVTAVMVANARLLGKGKQEWRYASKSKYLFRNAHSNDEAISSIEFFSDGLSFVSRSTDGTIARWDQRNLKKALWVTGGLLNYHDNTCVRIGPTERHVATGTSALKDGDHGDLVFLNAESGEIERKLSFAGSVVGLGWHDKINQIIVGHGGRKEGGLSVLYNPSMSTKGAKLALATRPRPADTLDWLPPDKIYLPQAAIREELPWKKARKPWDRSYVDPKEKTRPSEGLGDAKGPGRIGSTHHALFVRGMIAKSGELTQNLLKDPREQLLRHDGKEGPEIKRLMSAYDKTQPVRIYNTEDVEREEEERAQKRQKT